MLFEVGMVAMLTVLGVLAIVMTLYAVNTTEEEGKFREMAKVSCTDKEFYAANFERCERLEVRPQK